MASVFSAMPERFGAMSLLAPSCPATSSGASAWQARQPSEPTSSLPREACPVSTAGAACAVRHSSLGCLVAERPRAAIWGAGSSPDMRLRLPVRGLDAVDRRSLPAVTRRASELLGRMLAEVELAPGVRLPRVPLVLEARLVDAGVARHAAVDARDRLVEVVAIELLEHELLDL